MAQRSILNYFSKTPTTPKAPGSGPSPSNNASSTTPKRNDRASDGPGVSTILVTPKRPVNTPSSSRSSLKSKSKNSTPSSNGKSRQKRGASSDSGLSPDVQNISKRSKIEDSSPSKEFGEGTLVWAKVEGYPFWPAMVCGKKAGKPFSRKNRTEFHVQFFDDPPTRAWIRKPDLKPFQSSTDGAVPPARNDPNWIKSCKTADSAVTLSPAKRIGKFWVHFEDESDETEEVMDTSETEASPDVPKSASSPKKNSSKGGRQVISDSSEDEGAPDKAQATTPVTRNKNGRARRQKIESDDDEDEYKPSSADVTMESEEASSGESEPASEGEDEEEDEKTPRSSKKPAGKKKPIQTPTSSKSGKVPNGTPQSSSAKRNDFQNRISNSSNYDSGVLATPKSSGAPSGEKWTHLSLKFLKPEEIRDSKSRRPDHPDYDPKTLYIPRNILDSFSPGVRQWWVLKSKHFDTILFFKLGKFYELYHMDAVIAVQELGIIYMKGDYAHCGFPEIAYSRNAATLVAKGYKVARIEQTETPEMMAERCKKMTKPTKFDRVVKREICQITTKGIRLASSQDTSSIPFLPGSEYLYAIAEMAQENGETEYGTCFVDTTLGTFFIGQFKDDRNLSRLRTMFAHHKPAQILYEKGKTSSAVMSILNNMGGVRRDALTSSTEFWSAEKVLAFLSEGPYFKANGSSDVEWPKNLEAIFNKNTLQLTPVEGWELGLKCLGAVTWFLKECLVEHDVLTFRQFELYFPLDVKPEDIKVKYDKCHAFDNMVIDGSTLRNLEITEGPKSLFSILDKCSTQFGKRLLRNWTCAPEANPENICKRQDAIEELMGLEELMDQIIPMLKSLLDLERLLGKIHTLGSLHRSTDHPDARASMYEEKQYSKRKIGDLTNALKNFKTCVNIISTINSYDTQIKSEYLSAVISKFPSLDKLLDFFDKAFDHTAAIKDGKIQPSPGVDEDYDTAFQAVVDVQHEADDYLKEVKERLKTKVVYFGSDKKRFQLEMSDKVRAPNDFELTSSRKGFKRYSTSKTKALLAKIIQSEINRENVVKDITRRVFAQFDSNRQIWSEAVRTISVIDVLFSLTIFSKSQENMCRPRVVSSEKPFMNIVDGRHPAVSQDTYIPNSSVLGSQAETSDRNSGTFVLLTGPNMGGKSTLMRQIGLVTVLAHMGVHVPAIKCEMSVVDRIFTRLGASDNISEGESTFFVELSETSSILQHSTSNSLVLMDELGRGTATYDGTAIAYSVAHALAFRNCRTIFSTHYHTLVEAVQGWPAVQLGHMACMVEKENEDDDDPTQETITFLYKMAHGPCPKSYGFNAARLAGIPNEVIRVAHKKAKELEAKVNKVDLLRKLCSKIRSCTLTSDDVKQIRPVVSG